MVTCCTSQTKRLVASAVCGFFAALAPIHADMVQTGPKFSGSGATGSAAQGYSVALSSDGTTAVVGGYGDNGNVGAAWIYTRSFNTWTQQGPKLVGSNSIGTSLQGYSVAISNDGNTVIVGGFTDNSDVGAAWVFVRNGSTWSEQTKLVGTGATGNARQGISVALSADGNTAAVGGLNDSGHRGAMWIFNRNGTTWNQVGAKLVGSNSVSTGEQGYSVALSGDGNTAASGGPSSGSFSNAAWVWTQSGGVWTEQAKVTPTTLSGQFGIATALSSDGNTLAVGANADGNYIGAAFIFRRSGSTWTQQVKLTGTGAIGQTQQGFSVALSGDGNAVLVGGFGDNSFAGAAWYYTWNGSAWSQVGTKLVGTGASPPSWQGVAVAMSDDGFTALVGGKEDASLTGAIWPFSIVPPDIAVEQPASSDIPNNDSRNVGPAVVGSPQSRMFTIKNIGGADLTGLGITIDGADAARFSVTSSPTAPVAGGGSTSFTVRFTPIAGGAKNADLHIASNDPDENPFNIHLSATGLSQTDDTDGDGLNDAAEFNMTALGFDWQTSQPSLVSALYNNANSANLYTTQQVQALNVNTPLLMRDSQTGSFKLTLGLKKSTNLLNYNPFPFNAPQTSVNANGEVEFQFTAPDNAAFYRLEAR